MSLIRQTALLVLLAVLLAVAGAVAGGGLALRDSLQQQLAQKNADNAQALALAASQQQGDALAIELLMNAQFDTGHYALLRWVRADGALALERRAPPQQALAPAWLQRWLPLQAAPGVAQLSGGWVSLGRIELASQASHAYEALWAGLLRAAAWAAGVALLALLAAQALLGRLRRPLAALAEQAQALARREFVTVEPGAVRELRPLTEALNAVVLRLREVFAVQDEQLESLRQRAVRDAVTGLTQRASFLAALAHVPTPGTLLLLRVAELPRLNQRLGHAGCDDLLAALAAVLAAQAATRPEAQAARLNGSDFALWWPDAAPPIDALRTALQAASDEPTLRLALGAAPLSAEQALAQALAAADAALAEAEGQGEPWGQALRAAPEALGGEAEWRAQIAAALADGQRLRLREFPVIDAQGRLLHWDCPLQLALGPQAEWAPAARWLPLARRCGLTVEADLAAVGLALGAIERDGQMRCVNLASTSLQQSDFLGRLRALLRAHPQAARQLGLEFALEAARSQFLPLQELSRAVHPLGVRLGLEHAGAPLQRIERLYQLGLDYVKLDRSVLQGVAEDAAAAGFVRSLVFLLRGLAVQAIGEGVDDAAQAQALFDLGLVGLTGPWATAQQQT